MSEIRNGGGEDLEESDINLRIKVPSGLSGQTKDGVTAKNRERKKKYTQEDRLYEKETKLLRHRLKIYFYAAVKYKDHICSFQGIYFLFMLLQMLKVGLITAQMFSFGDDRVDFNNVVHRGHLTLRHLLLEGWDASWETLPYPPAQGDFAVYDIATLKEKINFAVTNLYNAEADAIGFFKMLDSDNVIAEMTYFDFPGFHDTTSGGLQIKHTSFKVKVDEVPFSNTGENSSITTDSATPTADSVTTSAGNATAKNTTVTGGNTTTLPGTTLTPTTTSPVSTSTDKHYTYDIDKDFERNNLSEPFKRLLTITIKFRIHSVRVDIVSEKARCLSVKGAVHFEDPDNNGQVIQDLETLTTRIKCADLNFDVKDRELETVATGLSVMVILMVIVSLVYTVLCLVFGVFAMLKTKQYMKKYFHKYYDPEDPTEKDLPFGEYAKFFKGWDVVILTADLTTIIGTFGMTLELKLLFNTIYNSMWDVLAYLACITLLFAGYMTFGYVVIGPYHVKFKTPSAAATTLFALINGDEIYATFALLEEKQTGGPLIPAIYQFYIGSYVAIFTIIVINLLIALFTNAYDAVKEQYENPVVHEESPMERALKKMLTSDEPTENKQLKTSISKFLKIEESNNRLSFQENKLRSELRKTMRVDSMDRIVLTKPRTLKAFILDEEIEDIKPGKCCCAIACIRLWGSEGHWFC